nr:GerMN domain-containing protein [Nanchangia anserum]
MTRSAFNNAYARRDVYFLAADNVTPVPDPRWIPRQNLTAGLVEALYSGPSPELAAAVRTAFPRDVASTSPVVDVTGAVAAVSVPDAIASLPQPQLSRVAWQLERTLSGVAGIERVELISDHDSLAFTRAPTTPTYDLDYLVGVEDGAIVGVGTGATRVLVDRAHTKGMSPRWPAAGPLAGQGVVALNGERTELYLFVDNTRRLLARSTETFSPPHLDRYGFVWTSTPTGGLWVTDAYGQRLSVATPWGDGGVIKKIELTPDGQRALVLMHANDRDTLASYVISREGGRPISLISAHPLAQPLTDIADIGWVDCSTAAVLSGSGGREIVVHPINGLEEIYAAPADATTLVTGGTTHDLQVMTDDYHRSERVGKQWRGVGTVLVDAAYPG